MKKIELDDDRLKHLVEVEQLTQVQIAELLGCDRSTIQRRCYSLGLKTQRTGPRSGDKHTGWKGGRRLVGGYWYIYYPDHPFATKKKTVAEHRLVVEENLKRYLLPSEVVHHRNGIRTDNRPENLEVFSSNAEHLKHELTGRVPNWTPEGYGSMLEGWSKRRNRPWNPKRDDVKQALSNYRQITTT